MSFQLVEGESFSVICSGCQEYKLAGSLPYRSASTGLLEGRCDEVYADMDQNTPKAYYCSGCARKHAIGVDTSRSVTQFYGDTRGEAVL
jgi:hypothetical protein